VAFAPPALRRLVLAVAVLYDVDLLPDESGVLLGPGSNPIRIEWDVIADVVQGAANVHGSTERPVLDALSAWLCARLIVAAGTPLCALGMPPRHVTHPGPAWIRERVPGGALALGFGYGFGFGKPVLPLPVGVLEHAGLGDAEADFAWKRARADLEALGLIAVERDKRRKDGPLVPVGSADVVTLLAATSLRTELAAGQGDGMAALIVPLRTRGWRANSISDPAYGPALAAAMSPEERGFERPLLVTAEELTQVRAGGDPMRLLRDDTETA
jgi:hypothetical protein